MRCEQLTHSAARVKGTLNDECIAVVVAVCDMWVRAHVLPAEGARLVIVRRDAPVALIIRICEASQVREQ